MKMISKLLLLPLLAALVIPAELSAAPKNAAKERIAVAEPRAVSGVSEADINGISEYLESKLGGNYDLFSRTALKAMLKEYAFNNSGMVLDESTRGQLAQKSVDCLLVYSISKLGSRLSLTMMVVDAATGEVRKGQRASVTARSLDELIGRLDSALDQMGLLAGAGEPSAVKKLAILPVGAKSGVSRTIPESLHSKLSSYLLKSGAFELVSREDLAAIAKESSMADGALSASGQFSKIGQLQLADYLAQVKIERYDHYEVSTGTALAGAATPSGRLTIQMTVRIVDVKTGKVIAVENVRDSMRTTEIPAASRRDWLAADYDNAFLERASAKLGNFLLDRIDPVMVAAVDGNNVYLTRGSGAGIYKGQYYYVFNPGRQIVHPKTKRVLGTTETRAGAIQVTQVAPDMSIAVPVGKQAEPIREGALCRSAEATSAGTEYGIEPEAPAPPPAYPMAN